MAPEASDYVLRLDDVWKAFQDHSAVRGVSLNIRGGEFLTLLGPSGCGKTTSLNLVAGLLHPDRGTIFLRGNPANTLPPRRRGLGMVFQSWALFPHLNVFDNIAYGLSVRSVSGAEIRARVAEMLGLVRLPGIERKFPSQLSGGMQQRVALARALITRPDLLLLDEPLSNLDAALRKEMQVELRRIHSELNVTTLLVTHSQEEALVMSDRIAVMRAGRIECVDTPKRVYEHPPNRFVCAFLGDANILDCEVEAVSAGEAMLRRKGLRFTAEVPAGLRPGQRITVAIRPENVILHRPIAPEATNGVDAIVRDAIFKGSHIHYELVVGEDCLQALAPPPIDGEPFGPGERARVTLPKRRIVAFASEEEGLSV
jgi:ABC-type Fe3+/spermidine/putrescine transport system ATPase subunit